MSRSHYRLALLGTCAERLSALKQLSRQFQIVSTPSPDLREALCPPTNGAPTLPAAIGTMLENPQIDILDINLPAQWHLPVTLQALKSGKHVICDAPVAADPDAIAQIDEAAAAAQRLVFPAFPNRHGRAIRVLSALQRRALLGPLRCATLEIHRASTAPVHTAEIAATGSFACHIHDLLGVIDGPVAEVSAATARSGRGDSSAVIWMRMASGALVSSAVLQGTGRNHCRLRLEFDHATVESGPDPDHPTTQDWVITPRDCARRKEFRAAEEAALLKPGPHYDHHAGVLAAAAARLNGLTQGDPLAPARQAAELATAINRACATGRAVSLPLSAA